MNRNGQSYSIIQLSIQMLLFLKKPNYRHVRFVWVEQSKYYHRHHHQVRHQWIQYQSLDHRPFPMIHKLRKIAHNYYLLNLLHLYLKLKWSFLTIQ